MNILAYCPFCLKADENNLWKYINRQKSEQNYACGNIWEKLKFKEATGCEFTWVLCSCFSPPWAKDGVAVKFETWF